MNLAKFFNHDFEDGTNSFHLYDKSGNRIYYEFIGGFWGKRKYDKLGNEISEVCSDGFWTITEYDSDGKKISYKCSDDKYADFEDKISVLEVDCQNGVYKSGGLRGIVLDLANILSLKNEQHNRFQK